MRAYTLWNDEKINDLLNEVDWCKKQGYPSLFAFRKLAMKLNVNPLTIRNLYYKKIKERGVKTRKIKIFSKDEEVWLFNSVNHLIKDGCSVRGACKKLANGDKGLFLRFQNKYLKIKNKVVNQNIITMNPPKEFGEEDIDILLKGVVNLIKNNALCEMDRKYNLIIEDYAQKLNNALLELNKKNVLLNKVLTENEELKCEKLTNISKLQSLIKI